MEQRDTNDCRGPTHEFLEYRIVVSHRCGSRGSANLSIGKGAVGTTSEMRGFARSRSKPKDPDRLKSCGMSEIATTDLKPSPNLPISSPRLRDRCEAIRELTPAVSKACPGSQHKGSRE